MSESPAKSHVKTFGSRDTQNQAAPRDRAAILRGGRSRNRTEDLTNVNRTL
jgi:hypothetical protein